MYNENENRGQFIAEISGKPAIASYGGVVPSRYGKTTLTLYSKRTVDDTLRIISGRKAEILNCEIDSAEILIKPNPLWLTLGILTLGFFGFGLIFIIVYFLSKHRFLLIRSKNNAVIVSIKGDMSQYEAFVNTVLNNAELSKRSLHIQ